MADASCQREGSYVYNMGQSYLQQGLEHCPTGHKACRECL